MLKQITFFDFFLHIQSICFNFANANPPERLQPQKGAEFEGAEAKGLSAEQEFVSLTYLHTG